MLLAIGGSPVRPSMKRWKMIWNVLRGRRFNLSGKPGNPSSVARRHAPNSSSSKASRRSTSSRGWTWPTRLPTWSSPGRELSSVSELTLTGKAAILVPSPNVAEDHQTKNAMALVKHDAAVLVRPGCGNRWSGSPDLAFRWGKASPPSERIAVLALPDAAKRIAAEVKSIASKGS